MSEPANTSNPSTSPAACSADSELLKQLEAQLSVPLFAMISGRLKAYEINLENAEMMILALKERMRLARIAKYGPGSEKMSDQQLELLEFEPGVSGMEVAAESEREELPPISDKKKHKHPGR